MHCVAFCLVELHLPALFPCTEAIDVFLYRSIFILDVLYLSIHEFGRGGGGYSTGFYADLKLISMYLLP